MKTICIAGAASGVGKTVLCEKLLEKSRNWAACKVTTCIGGTRHICPRGKANCGVCNSLKADYEILEEERSSTSRKDTQRLLKAGAEAVLWVKTKPGFLKISVEAAIARLKDYDGIVFEGNHVLEVLEPDIAVMIRPRDIRLKSSAKKILGRVNIFLESIDETKICEIIKILGGQECRSTIKKGFLKNPGLRSG